MCGIAAVLGSELAVVRTAVERVTAAQAHRGPDDAGVEVLPFGDCFIGLGHRRLSILDLSAAGRQPMTHPRSGACLIFNGEIYNFAILRQELVALGATFRGHSDTEVLLNALERWGRDCLKRLEGMFAFAIVTGNRLLVARDPAGIKPLYIAEIGPTLLIASEVQALLASGLVPAKLDRRGLAGMLAYGAVQQPCTLLRDVRSLPPGCWQEFTARAGGGWTTACPQPYWSFPACRHDLIGEAAVTAVSSTLDAAVRDHLVSDVPVGIFLSSGLDSTLIAGLAARHHPGIRSFTVAFADQPELSEGSLASATALRLGLDHMEISLPAEDVEASVRDWLGALDQPSMDGLNMYVIARAVRQQGIKVALSGLGGDELFGGYPSFHDVPRLQRLLGRLAWMPQFSRQLLAWMGSVGKPAAYAAKLADMFGSNGSLLSLFLHRRRMLSDGQMASLGLDAAELGLTADFQPPETLDDWLLDDTDSIRAISQLESRFYQGNMLLRDADANSMAHGLEVRVPMLDRRLLDLVHSLPGSVRSPPGSPAKHLLRQAGAALLTPEVLGQAKRGFVLPIQRWLLGCLRPVCEQGLTVLKDLGFLRPAGIDALWRGFLAEPDSALWTRAFTLGVLGDYIRRMRGV